MNLLKPYPPKNIYDEDCANDDDPENVDEENVDAENDNLYDNDTEYDNGGNAAEREIY